MRKVAFFALVGAALTFASCEKCKDCHYDVNGNEVEIGELCDDDLENAEANGYAINDSTTVTIHCEEH